LTLFDSLDFGLISYNRKVLLLGAGFVVKPTLDILTKEGVQVTVGKDWLLRYAILVEC
jgi:hypothetical protein